MAVIPFIVTPIVGSDAQIHGYQIIWPALTAGDTGQPYINSDLADRSVQVSGDFGGGGNVIVEGSNNESIGGYVTLNDPFNVPLVYAAAAIRQVEEMTQFIRPRAVGVNSITAVMVARTFAQTTITV